MESVFSVFFSFFVLKHREAWEIVTQVFEPKNL
jgi:hypothetical protein